MDTKRRNNFAGYFKLYADELRKAVSQEDVERIFSEVRTTIRQILEGEPDEVLFPLARELSNSLNAVTSKGGKKTMIEVLEAATEKITTTTSWNFVDNEQDYILFWLRRLGGIREVLLSANSSAS